jgi:hypothetical protein
VLHIIKRSLEGPGFYIYASAKSGVAGPPYGSYTLAMIGRAATGGKTPKTKVLPGFCRIEGAGGSGGTLVMWPLMWRSCLPKIGRIGPGGNDILTFLHKCLLFMSRLLVLT